MKKLAIIGHPIEGDKIIEILKMLGGKNKDGDAGWKCKNPQLAYYINGTGWIEFINTCNPNENILRYTLEEFLEKFPYMVGDKVIIKGKNQEAIVDKVVWCCDTITYWLKYDGFIEGNWRVEHLQPYKEETAEEKEENFGECIEKTIQECLFGKEETRKEIKIEIPKGYKFAGIDDDNQRVVFTRIQSQYPKTYKECCEVLGVNPSFDIKMLEDEESTLYFNFIDLVRCRNAYWKIAGDWKPDWSIESIKYVIEVYRNNVRKNSQGYSNTIFAFPTAEMRDAFYENFKELIENCKELL